MNFRRNSLLKILLILFLIKTCDFITQDQIQVYINIIGGVIVTLAVEWLAYYKKHLMYGKFRAIFGDDICNEDNYFLIYAELPQKMKNKFIYKKNGHSFSMSKAVSISEARAIGYLSKTFSLNAGISPRIESDQKKNEDYDKSFISFGLSSNNKTLDCIRNAGNDTDAFVYYDEKHLKFLVNNKYVPKDTNKEYGFILKIHPKQFPNRVWIVCAGYGEWGTSGAAWYLANKWKDIFKTAKNKPFAVMIKVDINEDQSAEVVNSISLGGLK